MQPDVVAFLWRPGLCRKREVRLDSNTAPALNASGSTVVGQTWPADPPRASEVGGGVRKKYRSTP
jgi:hypothetical protein